MPHARGRVTQRQAYIASLLDRRIGISHRYHVAVGRRNPFAEGVAAARQKIIDTGAHPYMEMGIRIRWEQDGARGPCCCHIEGIAHAHSTPLLAPLFRIPTE
jgi:hypothetical protein